MRWPSGLGSCLQSSAREFNSHPHLQRPRSSTGQNTTLRTCEVGGSTPPGGTILYISLTYRSIAGSHRRVVPYKGWLAALDFTSRSSCETNVDHLFKER